MKKEMIKQLVDIYNNMLLIETKGESTIYMAQSLTQLNEIISLIINTKEEETDEH